RRRHTRSKRDWSSDVCSSDLNNGGRAQARGQGVDNTPPSTNTPTTTHTHAHTTARAQRTTMCNTRTHVEGLNCMTNPRRTNSTRDRKSVVEGKRIKSSGRENT